MNLTDHDDICCSNRNFSFPSRIVPPITNAYAATPAEHLLRFIKKSKQKVKKHKRLSNFVDLLILCDNFNDFRKFLIITNHLLLVNIFLVIMYGQNCYFILARWKSALLLSYWI